MRIVNIQDLPDALRDSIARVVTNVVEESVSQMKTLAPVKTGALRDSIGVEFSGKSIIIGASVPYAPFVEFGTENSDPNPFVRPTVDSIDAIIKRAIAK